MGKVCGVGINDAGYQVSGKGIPRCKYHRVWSNMINRCYSSSRKKRGYDECTVADEWLTFSNFKNWMEKQDHKGKELDKDILVIGNEIYGPDYCTFVDRETNMFMNNRTNKGYSLRPNGTYVASISFKGKCEYLGQYDSEKEAANAYLMRKREIASELSDKQSDNRIKLALMESYSA